MRERMIIVAAFLALATAAPVRAQDSTHTPPVRDFELWAGVAQDSPRLGALGETPGMNLALIALRFSRPMGSGSSARRTTYHVDIVPVAIISPSYESARASSGADCRPDALCVIAREQGSGFFPGGSILGVGISPLGLTTHFRRDRAVSPALGLTGGAMYFDAPTPTTRAGRANFTASLELGLHFNRPEGHAYLLTYRLHHISNARTAPENPGVASHLFTFGLRPNQAR